MQSIYDLLKKAGYFIERFKRSFRLEPRPSKHRPYTRKKYNFEAKKKARKVAYQSRKINRRRTKG